MKNKNVLALILSAVMLFTLLTGCQTTTDDAGASTPESSEAVSEISEAVSEMSSESSEAAISEAADSSEAEQAEDDYYPVTITNYNYAGDEVTYTYEKAPERVIAVYQGCIETMIALGLEDHVLASYGLDNEVKDEWKTGFGEMNYDDSVFAPDKETVMTLEPDFIFSWGSYWGDEKLGDVDYWNESGIGTYMSSNTRPGGHPRTLENEYQDIINIGKIFNVEDKAQAIVDDMKNEIENVLTQTDGQESQTVAVVEFLGDSISNYGQTSLAGDIVTQLSGALAMPDASKIGKEDLIEADPEVIFVVYMERGDEDVIQTNLANITEDESLANLRAVQNGRVYPIMLGDMYASAVRTGDGITTVAAGLYPELYS